MKVIIPTNKKLLKEALETSFQSKFPETVKCSDCNGKSRLGFVTHEIDEEIEDVHVCDLYKNNSKSKGLWLHDACCVAVYFCEKCLEPTALYNQA